MIPRIFRQIVEEQRLIILTMIMVHIGVLDVVRRAQLRPGERQLPNQVREEVELFLQAVMPSVFGYVNDAPLTIIIGLLGVLLDKVDVQVVARAKVGLAILTMFLSRAELLKQAVDVDKEDWMQWYIFFGLYLPTLSSTTHCTFTTNTLTLGSQGQLFTVYSSTNSNQSSEVSFPTPSMQERICTSGSSWLR